MKYLIILILFVFYSTVLLAQESVKEADMEKSKTHTGFITFDPLTPTLNPLPRWRMGYNQYFGNKYGIGLEIGYGNKNLTFQYPLLTGYMGLQYNLWEIRPKVYRYLDLHNKVSWYIAVEFFFINHNDIYENDEYYFENLNKGIGYDRVHYNRKKYGVHIINGKVFNISSIGKVNLYYGIGFRIRDIHFSEAVNPRTVEKHWELGPIEAISGGNIQRDEGSHVSINFSLGFNILFKVKN